MARIEERVAKLEVRVQMTEQAVEDMTTIVVPEIQKTLRQQADDIRKTRETGLKQKTDFGWVMRIAGFVLTALQAIGTGLLIYVITSKP